MALLVNKMIELNWIHDPFAKQAGGGALKPLRGIFVII
jgi:hypothetical protein